VRVGNWLTAEEGNKLLGTENGGTPAKQALSGDHAKYKRNALAIGTGK
jgi:hypothetical protein